MAVSKSAEKERLKKERVSKLGKELLDKEMKSKDIKQRIATATSGGYDGDKWYGPSKYFTSMSKKELASQIIQEKNRKMSGGNAAKRMKDDKKTMGYKTVEKSWSEKPLLHIERQDLLPQYVKQAKKTYGDIEGQKRVNEENNRRRQRNFDAKYKNVLKNKWEDPMYGIKMMDKKKMMKKKVK